MTLTGLSLSSCHSPKAFSISCHPSYFMLNHELTVTGLLHTRSKCHVVPLLEVAEMRSYSRPAMETSNTVFRLVSLRGMLPDLTSLSLQGSWSGNETIESLLATRFSRHQS